MPDLIVTGSTVIRPTLILGYQSTRAAGNVVHPIINRPSPDVTLRPASLRTGTLELLFAGDDSAAVETASAEAETLHATAAVFTLISDDRPSIAMSYVVSGNGQISRALDPSTRDAWTVTVPFQEVGP